MEDNENIYAMELHDVINVEGANITRVPGGWLYSTVENIEGMVMALPPCFVPFNDEFKVKH